MWTYQYIDRKDIVHYGVPGMKWGVRRKVLDNRNQTISTRNKRLSVKRDRAKLKAEKARARLDDPRRYKSRAAKLDLRASKLDRKESISGRDAARKAVRISRLKNRSRQLNDKWLKRNTKKLYGEKGYRALMKSRRFQKQISRGEELMAKNAKKIADLTLAELRAKPKE